MLIFSVTENFEKELADARDQNLQTLRTEEEKQMQFKEEIQKCKADLHLAHAECKASDLVNSTLEAEIQRYKQENNE